MGEPSGPAPRPPVGGRRTERRALLEIVALCGLVIAQPVLDVSGRNPDFFLFHGADTGDILLLVAVVTVVPPLVLWGLGALARLAGRRVREATHTMTVGVLLAVLAVQVGKHLLPLRGTPLALLAVAVAAAGLYAYRRWRASGQVLRFAAVGPLVFALLFVLASPTSALVIPVDPIGGGGSARGSGRPPVVMLVLDELPLVSLLGRDGRIDERRFPHFARLAAESTWYRNTTAVSGSTPYALPAMLTGNYPTGPDAPHYARYPDNLFTLLGGYDIRAWESISQLCPPTQCDPASRSARGGLPALLRDTATLVAEIVSPVEAHRDPASVYREPTRGETGQSDETSSGPSDSQFRFDALGANQPARFTEFLSGLRPTDRPTLHFLHLLLPHSPWTYLPSGMRYEPPDDLSVDGDWAAVTYQRHLAQVGYVDRLLGQTIRQLTDTGLWDDALVVVTADHGQSFTPGAHGRRAEQARRAPGEVLWVPLFVKEPGQRTGRIDDRNWEQIDLLPTIAAHLNVRVPWRTDGVSMLDGERSRAEKRFHGEPGETMSFSGREIFPGVLSGAARPALPAPPAPDLLGRPVAELPGLGDSAFRGQVTVANRSEFADVDPAGGMVPALVCGTASPSVPAGIPLAIAVNGRIATVVRLADQPDPGGRRFCGLAADDSLFRSGANRVELFEVAGTGLRRLSD